MRVESRVTSISWIPSECIQGPTRLPFDIGINHYDQPPPDVIDDLDSLRAADRFRFANELRAWIEVAHGRILDYGQTGGGQIGSTTVRLGAAHLVFAAVPFPDQRPAPIMSETAVRFEQTAGGRTGLPAPRRVSHPPYVRIGAPIAWTRLALTLHADGRAEHHLVDCSPFPRHWVYDAGGRLTHKSGLVDFQRWYDDPFAGDTPWAAADQPVPVVPAESALERQLSRQIMSGARPTMTQLTVGETLIEQGNRGGDLFLLLDGILSVEVDGQAVAQLGPGAIVGERALLEGGRRTATLRAIAPSRVASARADQIERAALEELGRSHHREPEPTPSTEPGLRSTEPGLTPSAT